MNIITDTRETKLLSYLQSTDNFIVKTQNLSIGDVHLCTPDNTCIVIFERKSINDLAASIQDGRYKEQGIRLCNSTIPNHHIIYIIEGDIDLYKGNSYSKHKINSKTLRSSIVSILFSKGFSVLFTKNIEDSARWIMNFADKIHRNGTDGYYNHSDTTTSTNYTEHIKMKKQANITPDNINQIMLCQIPGINFVIANAILECYKTIHHLSISLHDNPNELDGFSYTTNQGKERKIPKNVISNLKIYLKI